MDKDKLIGICLLCLVFFMFMSSNKARKAQEEKAREAQGTPAAAAVAAAPQLPGELSAAPELGTLPDAGETVISNGLFTLSFDNGLGDLKSALLSVTDVVKEPYETASLESAGYEMPGRLGSYGSLEGRGLRFGLAEAGALGDSVTFTGVWNSSVLVTKKYAINPSNYLVRLSYSLKNLGEAPLPAAPLQVWLGTVNKLKEAKDRPPVRTLTCSYLKDDARKIKRFNIGKERKDFDEEVEWAAVANRYFVHMLSPVKPASGLSVTARPDKKAQWLSGLLSFPVPALKSGEEYSWEAALYIGPKQYETLKALDGLVGHGEKYVKIIDLGWYSIIATGLMQYGLKWTYGYTGSYGISIIILTVVIKLLLWPLTTKSTLAMKKMQKLQPEIKAIQEKFKDDPRKQQEEMMLLYRKYGYNPMGGCLPMLIQLPVFVALYQALSNAIELHHTPFLWISDLSLPDKVCAIAGFPVHPLAIAMGVGMLVQQMTTPKMGDATQQKMMYIMPVIFTCLFYNMPSGLVLYWFVNQLLTMAQTTYLQYRKD